MHQRVSRHSSAHVLASQFARRYDVNVSQVFNWLTSNTDTPETSKRHARCGLEIIRGKKAIKRLQQLMPMAFAHNPQAALEQAYSGLLTPVGGHLVAFVL